MPFQKTTFVTNVTPVSAAELNNLGDGIVEAQRAPFVTALPTTGPGGGALADGQECYYKPDPTGTLNKNVAWHLKYEASSAKWYYIGGPPLVSIITADETFTADATYQDATTVGPSLTVPVAGDYTYTASANGFKSGTALSFVLALKIGAAAVAAPHVSQVQSSGLGAAQTVNLDADLPATAAGTLLKLQYNQSGGGTADVRYRRLALTPVRLG